MLCQTLNSSAAEIYGVDKGYTRFDQKNNLIIQAYWNDSIKKLENIRKENLQNYIKKNKSGYSCLDYAFYAGALSFIDTIDYGINICDQGANNWSNEINEEKLYLDDFLDSAELTKAIKKTAEMYGASAVGIAALDKKWVFSHWFDKKTKQSYPIMFSNEDDSFSVINKPTLLESGVRVIPEKMKYVIVFLFEMNYECLQYSPTLLAFGESVNIYAKMSLTTMSMAGFTRSLGYNAIPSINCTALNIPLAIDAGLGQIGRNGKLINPQFGPRVRIAKVITDMPLIPDKPTNFGVTEFCEVCKKCAKECPSDAITNGLRSKEPVDETGNQHYLRWVVDHKKCFEYWAECGTNCNICLTVCSYNRGYKWTKSVLGYSNENNSLIDNLLDTLDDDHQLDLLKNKSDYFWGKA